MTMMWTRWHGVLAVCLFLGSACGSSEDAPPGPNEPGMQNDPSTAAGMDAAGGTGAMEDPQMPGASGGSGGSGEPTAGSPGSGGSGAAGTESVEPPPEVIEMLDDSVDWDGLEIVFPQMYSAYDGVHTFQVPARVEGVTVELSDWQAIPSSAVSFDPDPDSESGGVLITVLEPVEQITIAASSGPIGGTAPLYVTVGTGDDWIVGEARYNNEVEYVMQQINLIDLFDPNYTPPETPTNLACNNCHTTGAKYLEIQHTPSQVAYISDTDLEIIFTTGMKPEGINWTVLPEPLRYLYPEFHVWDASDDEVRGLIIYLRSLTPTSQGDIKIPDEIIFPMM